MQIQEVIKAINQIQADGLIEHYAIGPHRRVAEISTPVSGRCVMSFDLQKINADKRALRRNLAARPIAEKLQLLDALREPELAIRSRSGTTPTTAALREEPLPCRSG